MYVGLEERLVGDAAFQDVLKVILIEVGERLGGDRVVISSAPLGDGSRQPTLFNPGENLRSLDFDRAGKTLNGEKVAANFAETVSFVLEFSAQRSGRAVKL